MTRYEELRQAEQAASPGPWEYDADNGGYGWCIWTPEAADGGGDGHVASAEQEMSEADATFCVLARNHMRAVLDENAALRAATAELRSGDGVYYLTQEKAMAPGIADGWPDVIPAPHTKNGRLVKRKFAIVDAQ